MAFYKKLAFGMCAAIIGMLSCHGKTFQEKLDAYFEDHKKEIQASIQAWDFYNMRQSEYCITEQELKDVVLRSYNSAVGFMQKSIRGQVQFFDRYREHLLLDKKTDRDFYWALMTHKKRRDGSEILQYFHLKYCNYSKYAPPRFPEFLEDFYDYEDEYGKWDNRGSPSPEPCLLKHAGAIDNILEDEDLMQTYKAIMKLLPGYIDEACSVYLIYRNILLELFAEESGKLKKPSEWRTWISKNILGVLSVSLKVDFDSVLTLLESHIEFENIVEELNKIDERLQTLCDKIRELSSL